MTNDPKTYAGWLMILVLAVAWLVVSVSQWLQVDLATGGAVIARAVLGAPLVIGLAVVFPPIVRIWSFWLALVWWVFAPALEVWLAPTVLSWNASPWSIVVGAVMAILLESYLRSP